MARLRSADGADRAALGRGLMGDSPSSGPSRPLPVSLLLRPAQAMRSAHNLSAQVRCSR